MEDLFVILNITTEYSLGEKIMNIASWHDIISSEFLLAKTFVKSVEARKKGTIDSKIHYINILCTYRVALKIIEDIKEELYYMDLERFEYLIRKVTLSLGKENIMNNEENKRIEEEANVDIKSIKKDLVAVYVIVEKGYFEDVVNIADLVGTRGATVIPAEGNKYAGKYIAPRLTVNPLKEVVVIVTSLEKSHLLVEKLSQSDKLMGKGKGIVFTTEVIEASGISL